MAIVAHDEVVAKTAVEAAWMVRKRLSKLRKGLHETMSLNPFLAPILYDLHYAQGFVDLGELLLAGHLMGGHNTSFGKLVDERVLPNVFGTHKLTGKYRAAHPPLNTAPFDDIDHFVERPGELPTLLSVKASKWTIQLAAAVNLNASFDRILSNHPGTYAGIAVGVFYGTNETLTDKYDILRGVNRGKQHDVKDLTKHVHVYAGRRFWSWLNGGEDATQGWVLDGIQRGLRDDGCREEARELLTGYSAAFHRLYDRFIRPDGSVDWHALLTSVNS